jgi:hypothetical protein
VSKQSGEISLGKYPYLNVKLLFAALPSFGYKILIKKREIWLHLCFSLGFEIGKICSNSCGFWEEVFNAATVFRISFGYALNMKVRIGV